MEHTQISTPKGAERKKIKIENFEAKVKEAIEFVHQTLLSALPSLDPEHQRLLVGLHDTEEWRRTYEHVLVNHTER